MVCGLHVCDELDENSFSDTYVNDREGDYIHEVTGVTLLRDDVAKARMEEMKWHEKFVRRGQDANLFLVDGETSTKVTANVWKCEVDWSRVRSNRKGPTATSQEHHHWHSCVT